MARLKHRVSGVVVNVPDETAARMAGEFEPVSDTKKESKASRRRSSDDESE